MKNNYPRSLTLFEGMKLSNFSELKDIAIELTTSHFALHPQEFSFEEFQCVLQNNLDAKCLHINMHNITLKNILYAKTYNSQNDDYALHIHEYDVRIYAYPYSGDITVLHHSPIQRASDDIYDLLDITYDESYIYMKIPVDNTLEYNDTAAQVISKIKSFNEFLAVNTTYLNNQIKKEYHHINMQELYNKVKQNVEFEKQLTMRITGNDM